MEDEELLFEQETSEEIQEEYSENESESSEAEETSEVPESGDDLTLDYDRLESAIMSDEFTLDSDLNDLFLTDVLLMLIVFILHIFLHSITFVETCLNNASICSNLCDVR